MPTRGFRTQLNWPRAAALTPGWVVVLAGGLYSLATPLLMIGGAL